MANNFKIQGDSPVVADLLFWRIVGHEALSRPSHYELTVLSEEGDLQPKDILGHSFDVVMDFQDKDSAVHQRHAQGYATRFMRLPEAGRYYRYQITLQSWFGLLQKRKNSRILQDKKVVESLEEVFADSPIKRIQKLDSGHVIGSHASHRYCVQFEETDYQFASRLMEEEGIYYWFDAHQKPGTMLLSDASDAAHDKLPAKASLSYLPAGTSDAHFNEISRWISAKSLDSGKYASADSDFKAIKSQQKNDKADPDVHELADLEIFEFAGDYWRHSDKDSHATTRMQELASRRQRYYAQTAWPDVAPGKTFEFKNAPHADDNGDYLIAACSFVVSHPGYEGIRIQESVQALSPLLQAALEQDPFNAIDPTSAAHYRQLLDSSPELSIGTSSSTSSGHSAATGQRAFLITSIPADEPWTPPRQTPKVKMPGPQSAIVVGPAGEEIHADDFGRVKVHFHWDRYDASNEKSTAWIRVNQPWAGKNWGGYFIPRIGQEVIVDFLNGDPDRPLIMGRVYNDDQPIPFESHTQSGFRTRSTPGGTPANCNEFRFDDKMGAEQVYLHAEKNQDIEVENDETHWVGRDRTKTIDRDETNHIKQDRTETVDRNEKITVHGWRTEEVDLDETITIHKNRTERVDLDEKISIGKNRSEDVALDETISIGKNRNETVGANESVSIAQNRKVDIGANKTQTIAMAYMQNVGLAKMTNVGLAYSINVGAGMNRVVALIDAEQIGKSQSTLVGENKTANVKNTYEITVGDEFKITVGKSTLIMKSDGTIKINGNDMIVGMTGEQTTKCDGNITMKGAKILEN
jgi:type VI secretion system secreted protein VgrG